MENKPASLLAVPQGKAFSGISILVVDRWLATAKRARDSAIITFS